MRLNLKFILNIARKLKKKKNLSGNCLPDMTISLTPSILRQQFPSVIGLEQTELELRNMLTARKSSFFKYYMEISLRNSI